RSGVRRMRGRYPSRKGPMAPLAKAWTEETMPLRVRKVPKIVRAKVRVTRTRFQIFSIGRRSCTMTEWTKAVPMSHGMKDAFSTGSQAQYPPQPRVRYDHHPP